MEFELGVVDRVTLLGALPPEEVQSNFLTLKSLRLFREELALTPKEAKEIGFEQNLETGRVKWSSAKEKPKKFSIDEPILKVIQRRLQALDAAGKLLEQHIPVYEKFVLLEETPSE